MVIGGESDKGLFDFIIRLREGCQWYRRSMQPTEKLENIKILKLHERFSSDGELRTEQIIFEIDSEDRWDTAIAEEITKER